MPSIHRLTRLGAVLLLTLSPALAVAQTPGITFGATPTTFTPGLTATRGWEFTVSQAIDVVSLGLYDAGGDGLVNSHQIGLWSSSSTLLASTTIASGTSATLGFDSFRYVTLANSLRLDPGTFRIGAFYVDGDGDQIAQNAAPVGAAGFVTFVDSRLSGPSFGDPTTPSAVVGGAFGPNFQFRAATTVVPEPSSVVLLLTGAGVLALVGRRRMRARG
jgi:hypothetical protein